MPFINRIKYYVGEIPPRNEHFFRSKTTVIKGSPIFAVKETGNLLFLLLPIKHTSPLTSQKLFEAVGILIFKKMFH